MVLERTVFQKERDKLLTHDTGFITFYYKEGPNTGKKETKTIKKPMYQGFEFTDGTHLILGDDVHAGISEFTDKDENTFQVSVVQHESFPRTMNLTGGKNSRKISKRRRKRSGGRHKKNHETIKIEKKYRLRYFFSSKYAFLLSRYCTGLRISGNGQYPRYTVLLP